MSTSPPPHLCGCPQVQRISQLEQEVQKLRQSLADKQAAKGKAGVPGSQTTLAPEVRLGPSASVVG